MSLFRLLAPAILAATVALAPASVSAQTFSDPQREEIHKIIRDYLIEHPEVLEEASAELTRRQSAAEAAKQASMVKKHAETIFNSPRGVVVGNRSGDVNFVEFFDYNCGYCKRALSDMDEVLKEDKNVRFVLKELPILGPDSVEASHVAVAVKNQLQGAKYFDFHNKLMAVKGKVNAAKALDIAKEAGADVAQLKKDMEAPATKAAIADTVALGDRLGLTGTPAFIVGDEIVFGAVGQAALKAKIDSVRRCGKTDCAG